jgi:predicted RNase H-like HicB family nuclease
LPQAKQEILFKKNIFDAIQFYIEGLKEEKLRIPKSQADSEVFVFAV